MFTNDVMLLILKAGVDNLRGGWNFETFRNFEIHTKQRYFNLTQGYDSVSFLHSSRVTNRVE